MKRWILAHKDILHSIAEFLPVYSNMPAGCATTTLRKKEWVLDNETVNCLNWEDLRRSLDYGIGQERNFSYKGITPDAMIAHITRFVSGLWQIHPFGEENIRTTAVFTTISP